MNGGTTLDRAAAISQSLRGPKANISNPRALFSPQRTERVDDESQSRWLENL